MGTVQRVHGSTLPPGHLNGTVLPPTPFQCWLNRRRDDTWEGLRMKEPMGEDSTGADQGTTSWQQRILTRSRTHETFFFAPPSPSTREGTSQKGQRNKSGISWAKPLRRDDWPKYTLEQWYSDWGSGTTSGSSVRLLKLCTAQDMKTRCDLINQRY